MPMETSNKVYLTLQSSLRLLMVDVISVITGTYTSPPVNMQDDLSMPHGMNSKLLVGITGMVICACVSFPVQSYLT